MVSICNNYKVSWDSVEFYGILWWNFKSKKINVCLLKF